MFLALGSSLASADSATVAPPIPHDLAFGHARLNGEERQSLSADGRWLAYTVDIRSEATGAEYRMPSGLPRPALDGRIFLTDTTTGEHWRVGPENEACWRPSLSPDGRQVSFYSGANGSANLWIYDVTSRTSRQLGRAVIQARTWAGDEPVWSRDGQEIFVPLAPPKTGTPENVTAPSVPIPSMPAVTVYVAGGEIGSNTKQVSLGERDTNAFFLQENKAALVAVNAASGEIRVVVPEDATPTPSLLRLSATGRWLAYMSVPRRSPGARNLISRFDLAVVPIGGGGIRVVATDLQVPSRGYYVGSYAWHPTRDQLCWIKDDKVWTLDLEGPSAAPRQLAPELADITRSPIMFTRDGLSVVVGTQPLAASGSADATPQSLALVPLDGGGKTRITPLPHGVRFQTLLRQREGIAWQPAPDKLTFLGREEVGVANVIAQLDYSSGQPTILWKDQATVAPYFAPADHQSMIMALEDMHHPVDLYRFTTDFTEKKRLTDVEPRLASIRFGPTATFVTQVPNFDGSFKAATSAIMLPAGAKPGDRLPTVVFLYPGSKVSSRLAEFGGGEPATIPASIFVTRGYAVLLVELPLSPFGARGNPVAEMVDALLPQVYHAAELGYVDLQRMAVCGQSYGGYGVAAVLATSNLFRAGIAISGMYDLAGSYAWMGPDSDMINREWSETGQGRMGSPLWSDVTRYITNSPYYMADRIQAPMLLLHGEGDTRCNVQDARKMFNALKRLDGTVQFAEYRGEGHFVNRWARVNSVDATRRMVEFLDKYLRPARPETSVPKK